MITNAIVRKEIVEKLCTVGDTLVARKSARRAPIVPAGPSRLADKLGDLTAYAAAIPSECKQHEKPWVVN
jgi:hypothetical protein